MIAATIGVRPMQYLNDDDARLLTAGRVLNFDILVGLHELLGHGSGKLFHEFANGTFDFNASHIESVGKYGKVQKWYEEKLPAQQIFINPYNFQY